MSKTKPRQIKLFYPHAEIKIFVTDEMIKDYKECQKCAKHGSVPTGEWENKRCSNCSWNEIKLNSLFWICAIDELEEKMNELIREGE